MSDNGPILSLPDTPQDTIDLTSEEPTPFDDSVVFVSQTKADNGVEYIGSYSVANQETLTSNQQQIQTVQENLTILDDDDDNLDLPSLDLDRKFKEIAKKRSSLETSSRPPILCGICREDEFYLQAHKRSLVSTHCGHIFCKPCLDLSLTKYKCCPICRKPLTSKAAYHVIFL